MLGIILEPILGIASAIGTLVYTLGIEVPLLFLKAIGGLLYHFFSQTPTIVVSIIVYELIKKALRYVKLRGGINEIFNLQQIKKVVGFLSLCVK